MIRRVFKATDRLEASLTEEKAGTDVPNRTDEALIEAHLSGDDTAFAVLMGRYAGELVAFLTKQTGSRATAEDVFQETFLQVHKSADRFDLDRRFKPWLYTISVNKARDHFRRNKRPMVSLSNPVGDDDGQSFVDLMAGDVPSPSEWSDDAEQRDRIRTAVDELPPNYREILLLSYYQRMSYNQIAETLEIPLGTVKSRLHSAVAAFGRAWEPESQEGEAA
jgi:RNA polymerase sigma-70 factor (ECF subfamily)